MSYLTPGAATGQGGQSHAGGGTLQVDPVHSSQDLAARRGSIGVTQQRSRRRSTGGNVLHTAECLKEKQVPLYPALMILSFWTGASDRPLQLC